MPRTACQHVMTVLCCVRLDVLLENEQAVGDCASTEKTLPPFPLEELPSWLKTYEGKPGYHMQECSWRRTRFADLHVGVLNSFKLHALITHLVQCALVLGCQHRRGNG